MACLVRNRNKFYKRSMEDIWGHSYTYKKLTKELRFISLMTREKIFRKWYYRREFVYSFRKKIRFKRRKRIHVRFLLPRYLKHYYLILKLDNFKKMQNKAVRKKGYYDASFLNLLEGRIFMLVFRLHFIGNMFMIKSIVSHGVFTVNGEVKYNSNFVTRVGDFISIKDKYLELIRFDMILRYKKKIIFWNTPRFMFINYSLMLAIYWRDIRLRDLEFFTDKIDIFLGSEYYYPSPK